MPASAIADGLRRVGAGTRRAVMRLGFAARFTFAVLAHSVEGLGYLRYGVATARRGGVRKGEVLNARGVEEFLKAVRPAAQG